MVVLKFTKETFHEKIAISFQTSGDLDDLVFDLIKIYVLVKDRATLTVARATNM